MNNFRDRTVVIAGGASGIGRAAASLFARADAEVVICDLDEERGHAAVADIRADGGSARFLAMDVTSDENVRVTFAPLERISVLVNCVGGSMIEDNVVTDVDLDLVWDRTMNLNLRGTFLTCRHAIPKMIAGGGGTIINLSSGAALRGASPAHVYTAAKGAILSLTRAIAGRYARDGIRANAICSGRVYSERIVKAYGRLGEQGAAVDLQDAEGRSVEYPFWTGEPVDMAEIILFLAGDNSRMITGATIQADGGRSSY